MTAIDKVVLVGHCGADSSSLSSVLARVAPGLPITYAYDQKALEKDASPRTLLLINRALDGSFATSNGIELIRQLKGHKTPPQMILISNFAWAQQEALEAGALPGFGKSQLYSPYVENLLRNAISGEVVAAK